MAERYVRPPLIAREAPSNRFAVWRYRAIAFIVLLALAVAMGWGVFKVSGVGNADPGFGGLPPVSRTLSQQAAAG